MLSYWIQHLESYYYLDSNFGNFCYLTKMLLEGNLHISYMSVYYASMLLSLQIHTIRYTKEVRDISESIHDSLVHV